MKQLLIVLGILFSMCLNAQEQEEFYKYTFGGGQADEIRDFSLSIDDKYIAYAGGASHNVVIQNNENKKLVKDISMNAIVSCVQYTSKNLVVGLLYEKKLKIFNTKDYAEVKSFDLEGKPVKMVYKGKFVYVATITKGLYKLNLETFSIKHIPDFIYGYSGYSLPPNKYNLQRMYYSPLIISNDGNIVATTTFGEGTYVYNNKIDKTSVWTGFPFNASRKIGISDDGTRLAIYAEHLELLGMLCVIDLTNNKILNKWQLSYGGGGNWADHLFFNKTNDKVYRHWKSHIFIEYDLNDYKEKKIMVPIKGKIYSSVVSGRYYYCMSADGTFLKLNMDNLKDYKFINTNMKGNFLVKTSTNSNVFYLLDGKTDLMVELNVKTEKSKIFSPSSTDCDGGVDVQLANKKMFALFALSRNIHIADYYKGKFSNGYTINLFDEYKPNVLLINFKIVGDYLYIPDYNSSNLYVINYKTKQKTKITLANKINSFVFTRDNFQAYFACGSDICKYSVNKNKLSLQKTFANTNITKPISSWYYDMPGSIQLNNNDTKLFYIDTLKKKLTCLDLNSGKRFGMRIYANGSLFTLNSDCSYAMTLNLNANGVIAKIFNNKIEKVGDVPTEVFFELKSFGYDNQTAKFWYYGNSLVEIDPIVMKHKELHSGGGTIVCKRAEKLWMQRGMSLNGMYAGDYWEMQYYDEDNKIKKKKMNGMLRDYFIAPSTKKPVFMFSTPDIMIDFCKSVKTSSNELNPEKSMVKVYPNPSRGIVYIDLGKEENAFITIYNSIGVPVKQINSHSKSLINIDLTGIDSGMYFIKIDTTKQSITKQILLI
ncbi:MAG: T9SS type A sorting domain-containing protein [Bacteroidales bacterium]|nr:T9SS type A sorting domain-containing protein [Bacteroidales bacterium]